MLKSIPPNSKLILAISGGPDSVYLLYKIINLSKNKKLSLHIAHLNHNTRGKQSNTDEIFVKNLAKKFNIPATFYKLSHTGGPECPPSKQLSEEYLRKQRYKFLEKVRRREKADFIITAHHQDDQIETIIFNFFRGTGPTGLIGMKEKQGVIFRPLLNISKEQILKYLTKNNIKYQVDNSNQNTNYNRNLIRHQILPLIKKINLNPSKSILNLQQILNSQQDFINQITHKEFKNIFISSQIPNKHWFNIFNNPSTLSTLGGPALGWYTCHLKLDTSSTVLTLSLPKFKLLHPAIQTNLIKTTLTPFVPENKQLSYKTIQEVVSILNHSQGGSQKILFNTLSISKKNDKIYLRIIKI